MSEDALPLPDAAATPARRRRRTPPPTPSRTKAWTRREIAVAIALTPLALWLGWRVLTLGLADLWAQSDPDSALLWRPADPQALVAAGDAAVAGKDFSTADTLARQAIAAYPLDGRGYRLIAQGLQFLGNDAAAGKLADIAIARSPRDVIGRMLVVDQAVKRNDFAGALAQIDVVLRIRPDLAPSVMPRFVAAASSPVFAKLIDHLLVQRPPWRLVYLQMLASSGTDPDAIDRVFAGRGADDPLPPPLLGTEADLLIRRQIADGRWGNAYFTWVGTLSLAQRTRLGNIYDGSFDFPPTNSGFDWRLPEQGSGFDVSIGPAGDLSTDSALQVHFDGLPLDYRPVRQLLILGPGHYRFSGMGGTSGIDTQEGGLGWTLTCAEGEQQALAATDLLSGDTPWGGVQMEFDVPDTGCAAQWLRLDLNEINFKGQPLHGTAVFDNLRIDRVDAGSQPAAAGAGSQPTTATGAAASSTRSDAVPVPPGLTPPSGADAPDGP